MATDSTVEARVLLRLPKLRPAVLASPDFHRWRSGLTTVNVDEETLYVRGGDLLLDEDQIIVEWARRTGLLTDAAMTAALACDRK